MDKKGSILLGFSFTIMIAISVMFYFKESDAENQINLVKRESLIINLEMARYAIVNAFEDPIAVARTFHALENQTGSVGLLECLTNPNAVCENVEKDLVVMAPVDGKMIANLLVQTNGKYFGFSIKSADCKLATCDDLILKDFVCDDFEASANSNSNCVFRLRTSWKPLCPSIGPCSKPKIIWIISLERNAASKVLISAINPKRLYFEKLF